MSDDDQNGPDGFEQEIPESLLPYDRWIEDSYREVMLRALEYVADKGLAGEHHFYVTFRTDRSDVIIPASLRAQYPEEMTIVLQHQFWDLKVDRENSIVSVGLSFGGVGSILSIPISAITSFADPYMHLALRFVSATSQPDKEALAQPKEDDNSSRFKQNTDENLEKKDAEVVSLDAFRKRPQT